MEAIVLRSGARGRWYPVISKTHGQEVRFLPSCFMSQLQYTTPSGIQVTRTATKIPYKRGLKSLLRQLDRKRGVYLSSGYEYPERYSRWDVASICPPIELIATQREVEIRPLNRRGEALNRILFPLLKLHPHWDTFELRGATLHGRLKPLPKLFPEQERSKH